MSSGYHSCEAHADAAVWYATIVAQRDRLGLPIDGFDGQIAAICRTRNTVLAIRNVKDFEEIGMDMIDSWQQSQPADHTTPAATGQATAPRAAVWHGCLSPDV